MNSNPAAEEGWVKSLDPASGRDFFANHITRKTQWEKPQNWVEPSVTAPPPPLPPSDDDDDLPSNWEVMRDPTTGKPFYVDHERQITSWKKPKSNKGTDGDRSYSHAPAAATTTFRNITSSSGTGTSNSSYHQDQHRQPASYHEEASYYNFAASHHQNTAETVDFSDTMPSLDFSVKTVSDLLRPSCASCDLLFTLSKRRHHCRLCGDVFCDACSNHRVELPLEGIEFALPVRVCDFCNKDVELGNFFSMRRYLTPLQLFDSAKFDDNHAVYDNDTNEVATPNHVNAALDALTIDLNQMLQNPSSSTDFGEKLSKIPTSLFITSIMKHLSYRATSDRAIRALASLLALENVAGSKEFTHSVYFYGGTSTLNDIMAILERSGSDRKNLFVQEQAARAIFYLTDPSIMTTLEAKHYEIMHQDDGPTDKIGDENSIDLIRTLRLMLDISTDSKNPNLQRWSASCIRNLVLEDQRRATMAVNDFAASVASGQSPEPMGYESFLDQLISTGGIMILCTLIGADDSDTRAHATAALGATLTATRAIDASLAALSEMTGGHEGSSEQKDGQIVRAIIAGGGCASSVSQLLLSADHNVAGMGCQFVAALVTPLLSLATGNLPWHYDCGQDQDVMGACREAALEITTGSCLPALVSLIRDHGSTRTRPIELRKVAMQTLVASVHAVGEMGKAWADGKYEEGLEISNAPSKLKDAMILLNEENVTEMALQVLQSSSTGQSLGSKHDTPAARIREGAAMILASLTACSAQAIMDLQTQQVLSQLLLSSNDASMTTTQSSLRADAAPRCLGILETVSSILMFAWQHPSGAQSELLDRLIEVLDAGAINYVSKVLSVDIDWESKEKAIGGMKGRRSCFKLLCCLFGIALTDETTIGMRRLMDAVDADSMFYKQQSSRGSRESRSRAPNNIMEATLKDLQIASNYAKRALIGSLSLGQHYQTALMDMVEAAVLAVGSMCGSSIAPGGGEGTLIKGENFLASRNDEFVSRRKSVCSAACDVVVRGGRSGPPLVPTMLVGGFGEGTLLASLRLSLAIAQNGTKEQHLKLALSGILVPTSDILRAALAAGELYKFSSALTLVRFCGPHIATGEGGGLQSVRDAIRVATNVLTLPIDPHATIEQIETQEALKSECVSALESLSRNAALWNSISKDAIPSMVRYLQSTSESSNGGRGSERHKETQCAVLRAVLQIVQVPSHAVSVAEGGLVGPLGKLLKNSIIYRNQDGDDKVPMLALEVLHVIAKNEQSRRKARFIDAGVFQSICAAVGYAVTKKAEQPSDPRADVTALGLEIIIFVLNDIENKNDYTAVLQSPAAIAFLDAVASEPHFVRAMCATFLLNTGMQIKRHDADSDWGSGDTYDVPELYGAPLVLVEDPCGGYQDTHQAVAAILMTTAVYACAIDSRKSASFWNTCLLKDVQKENTNIDDVECTQTACTFSAIFLALLGEDFKPFIPLNPNKQQSYLTIVRPLIRHRLLEALKESIDRTIIDDDTPADPYVVSVLVQFNVPQICLSLWKDPALLDLAFGLIKRVIEIEPDDVLHLFVASKQSIQSLFDLLNLDSSSASHTTDVSEMRKFLAGVLGTLSENGLLQEAVKKFDARSSAIGALAAACLMEENSPQCSEEEDEDMISNKLSSGLMKCLVELCTSKNKISNEKGIFLSPTEADAIAKNLGKKLCHMVLSRFLERAKLQQYEMEEDEEIMEAPDVAMLCAVVQHPKALKTIRSIGGLAALSQIASEGDLMAILAMKKACDEDASILLEDDIYLSIMSLFMEENDKSCSWRLDVQKRRRIEEASFEMLGQLCRSSQRGRKAIARSDKCIQCAAKALEVVSSFTSIPKPSVPPVVEDSDDDDTLEDKSVSEDDGNNSEDDDSIEKISEPEVKESKHLLEPNTPPPPAYDDRMIIPDKVAELVNMEEADLGVSCLSFLSAVVSVINVRKEILEDENFIKSLSVLVTKSVHAELQFEALNLLKKLAPYAESDMVLSAEWLAETFQVILERKLKGSDGTKLNTNLLHSATVAGLRTIFDCLSNDTQLKITETVVIRFMKLVKSFTAARAASGVTDRQNGGELAHNLSVLLLLGTGKDCLYSAYTQQLLSSFINVAQWRYDPKTKLNDDIDRLYWDSAVTHCLQILSLNLSRTNAQLSKTKLNLTELSKTILMLARPGKAPRRAIDVNTALTRVAEKGDASARMAARNIVDLLF